jgi:hypothetical protein
MRGWDSRRAAPSRAGWRTSNSTTSECPRASARRNPGLANEARSRPLRHTASRCLRLVSHRPANGLPATGHLPRPTGLAARPATTPRSARTQPVHPRRRRSPPPPNRRPMRLSAAPTTSSATSLAAATSIASTETSTDGSAAPATDAPSVAGCASTASSSGSSASQPSRAPSPAVTRTIQTGTSAMQPDCPADPPVHLLTAGTRRRRGRLG